MRSYDSRIRNASFAVSLARVSILIILGVFIAGCATTGGGSSAQGGKTGKTPEWVTDKDSAYPPEKYLAEVGEGDSLNGAKANAAGAIAQIFKTRVKVDSTIRTRYTEITGGEGDSLGMVMSTEADQKIGQSAEESLSNLRYGESWTDSMGRVYVVAYLDRAETGNLYRRKIMDNDQRVVELMKRAGTQTDALRRYAFLDAALVFAEVNNTLVEQLDIINMPMARSVVHPYKLGELRASSADQAASLMIRVEAAGDPSGRIAAVLSDWVTGKGFTVNEKGDMFLAAVMSLAPVKLNNNYENLNWELNVNLLNSTGYPAVSMSKSERSSGISKSAAESRAYADMAEVITRDFDREFNRYLKAFLEK